MGIRSALSRAIFGSNESASPVVQLRAAGSAGALVAGGPRQAASWPILDPESQQRRAWGLSVAAACIDAIARDVSAAPLRVWTEPTDGVLEPADSPAARNVRALLRRPNPQASEAEFWYAVVAQAAVAGFCVVEKVRAANGNVVQLWPLVSPWLKMIPRDQKSPDWEYRVPGNDPFSLAAEDVVVFAYRPDPMGDPRGRSPLRSLRRELAIADELAGFLFSLLERGGVPIVGLKVNPIDGEYPMVPEDERNRIIETFMQKYGGARNWAGPMFLGGVEPVKIGLDLDELLYPDLRDAIQTEVCLAFGVPSGLIGTLAGMERNTFSNYETSVRQYYDGTVAPLWARLDGAFSRGLLPEFDPAGTLELGFDTSDIAALQEDEGPRWDRAARGLAAGFLTLDEARTLVGLDELEGGAGQLVLLPFSATPMRPADLLAQAEEAAKPPEPVPAPLAEANGDDEDEPIPAPEGERWEPWARTGTDATGRAVFLTGNYRKLTTRHRDHFHTRSKAAITRAARRGAPMLRAFWKAQGRRIVEQATRSAVENEGRVVGIHRGRIAVVHGQIGVRDLTDIDWDEEARLLGDLLARLYGINGEAAYAEAAAVLGIEIDWTLSNPRVRMLLDELATRVVGVAETTRKDVADVVATALDEGVGVDKLADRLTGLFEETYKGRAQTVARTESQVAYNRANVLAYEESGVVSFAELLDNPNHGDYGGDGDGLTCAQRDGMVVPLLESERHIMGTHPNCVLAIAPVVEFGAGVGA